VLLLPLSFCSCLSVSFFRTAIVFCLVVPKCDELLQNKNMAFQSKSDALRQSSPSNFERNRDGLCIDKGKRNSCLFL